MSLQQLATAISNAPGTVTSVATSGLASGGPIIATGTVTVSAAAKSDQQTGSSNVLAVTPLHQQDHDSAAKAWVNFTDSTVNGAQTINASYNVSGVSRTAAGIFTVTFTTAFATANYVCVVSAQGGAQNGWGQPATFNTGSIVINILNSASVLANGAGQINVVCFGRQ